MYFRRWPAPRAAFPSAIAHLQRTEQRQMIRPIDARGFQITHMNILVMHDVINLGDGENGWVRHVEALAGLLTGVHETVAQQIGKLAWSHVELKSPISTYDAPLSCQVCCAILE